MNREPGLDIGALYVRHADDLMMFFVRRTADVEVASDLWAETFAQALAGRRRYRGGTDVEAAGWLWGIGRKQLAMYYRKGRAEKKALSRLGIERPPIDPTLEEEIARRAGLGELRRELALAIAALSAPTRAAVRMRIVDELPYPELAARLRISEPAARARVSRGLRALAHALDPDLIEEAAQP